MMINSWNFKWPDMIISTAFRAFIYKGGEFHNFHDKEYNYYGITWSEDTLYLAVPDKVYSLSRNGNGEIIEKILPYNESDDIHQILYRDKKIYIANTTKNLIDIFNTNDNSLSSVEIGDKRVNRNHINSLFFRGDTLYACFHNNEDGSFIFQYNRDFSNVDKLITNIGKKNHNVYVDNNNDLFTLNSSAGSITKINVGTLNSEIKQVAGAYGIERNYTFGRGLARGDGYFIIGLNKWSPIKDTREHSLSYILALDDKLNILGTMRLPIQAQAKDIRIISEKDYAHNQIEFPL